MIVPGAGAKDISVSGSSIDDQSPDNEAAVAHSRAPRKNLLLSASIEAGGLKAPVRIRNLSENGAMIDGAALPEVGTALVLRRLEVEIGATTVWRASGRCGIRFDGNVSVEEWVAGVCQPSFGTGQARVDAIQAAIRSGAQLPPESQANSPPVDLAALENRIAEEIAYARRLLDRVGDELTDDPVILQRHGRSLQTFDEACQILDHLGRILGAPNPVAAVQAVTMEELRARLLRK